MSRRTTTPPPGGTPRALDTARVAAKLGSTDTISVELLIAQMTATCERLVRRPLWYRTFEELATVRQATQRLYLSVRPLAVVSSVFCGNTEILQGNDADAFEVWADAGYLGYENGAYCWAPGSYRVAYTAGYWLKPSMGEPPEAEAQPLDELHADIQRAIEEWVSVAWQQQNTSRQIKAADLRGLKVEYFEGYAMTDTTRSVIMELRDMVVA